MNPRRYDNWEQIVAMKRKGRERQGRGGGNIFEEKRRSDWLPFQDTISGACRKKK